MRTLIRSTQTLTRAAALMASILAAAVPAAAQEGAVVRGRLLEGAGEVAVADAEVTLPGLRVAVRSDREGRFEIAGVPEGRHQLLAWRLGYHAAQQSVEVPAASAEELVIRLQPDPRPVAAVQATGASVSPRMREFEARRARGRGGRFLVRADLDQQQQRRLGDILRGMPGVQIVNAGGGSFVASRRGQPSQALNGPARPCYAQVYLDGSMIFSDDGYADPPNLSEFTPLNLEAVEYYPNESSTPPELRGQSAQCGTLVLWSREGR